MSLQKSKPSDELNGLIGKASASFVEFSQVWNELRFKGAIEGFDEKTLQGFIIEQIKARQLNEKEKLTDEQIKKKVWYMLHKEEHGERQKQRNKQKAANNRQIDDNKNLSHSSPPIEKHEAVVEEQ